MSTPRPVNYCELTGILKKMYFISFKGKNVSYLSAKAKI